MVSHTEGTHPHRHERGRGFSRARRPIATTAILLAATTTVAACGSNDQEVAAPTAPIETSTSTQGSTHDTDGGEHSERPTEEVEFVIDQSRFENWESLSEQEKTQVLIDFIEANDLTEITPNESMSTEDTVKWVNDVLEGIFSAAKSNKPLNFQPALRLLEAVTADVIPQDATDENGNTLTEARDTLGLALATAISSGEMGEDITAPQIVPETARGTGWFENNNALVQIIQGEQTLGFNLGPHVLLVAYNGPDRPLSVLQLGPGRYDTNDPASPTNIPRF